MQTGAAAREYSLLSISVDPVKDPASSPRARRVPIGPYSARVSKFITLTIAALLSAECAVSENGPQAWGGAHGLRPAHRQILQEAGYLDLVNQSLDQVEYFPYYGFQVPNGPAIGLSFVRGNRRVAQVATLDRSDDDIVSVIVHESAHASLWASSRRFADEQYAQTVAAQFVQTLRLVRCRQRANQTRRPGEE